MKLAVKNETITLVNGDCFNVMDNMNKQEVKVDLILTSPPYNTSRTSSGQRAIDNHENRYDIFLDTKTQDEYLKWTVELFNKYNSILREDGVILYNVSYGNEDPNTMWLLPSEIIRGTDFMIADTIIWKKSSALPNNTSSNKLTRITEFVFVFCRKDEFKTFNCNKQIKTINERTKQKFYENMFNFIEARNNDGSNDLNKATFSSELVGKLLDMYYKGGSVYDSFSGTGTTLIECARRGIKAIGSELSEAQCKFTEERLKEI